MMQFISFGIELNQEQIDFIKGRFGLETNGQVRLWLENAVRQRLNRMSERYYGNSENVRNREKS